MAEEDGCEELVAMDVMSVSEMYDIGKDDLHECHEDAEAYDDVTNEPLKPELVIKARAEELKYFEEMDVYEYATLDECMKVTKKAPKKRVAKKSASKPRRSARKGKAKK